MADLEFTEDSCDRHIRQVGRAIYPCSGAGDFRQDRLQLWISDKLEHAPTTACADVVNLEPCAIARPTPRRKEERHRLHEHLHHGFAELTGFVLANQTLFMMKISCMFQRQKQPT